MLRILSLILLFPVFSEAQMHKYFIGFTDKSNSAFTVNQPEQFLSQRAIDRRDRQHILITEQDLPVNQAYVDGVTGLGATMFTRSKWFNGITVECDSNVLTQILQLPYVQNVTGVYRKANVVQTKFSKIPAPYKSHNRLETNPDYGDGFNQIHLMNGEFLHDIGSRGEGMLIAVLDAGFFNVDVLNIFSPLISNNQILVAKDFVQNDSMVFDAASHGMSVLSCISADQPGIFIGTAPKAKFLLLRSEDESSENIIEEYNWNAAAEYADSAGADLITSSLGYTTFDDSTKDHSYSDMNGDICPASIAADIAASKGILVINSAGNSGASNWHYIGAPADGDSVLAVGAVDENGHFAFFSSYGPASDGAVKPNVAAKGQASSVANTFNSVSTANGTSFSCPILAGSAACLWQTFPEMSAWEIKTWIERCANYYSAPNDSLGYGIPDFRLAYDLMKYGALPTSENLKVYPSPFTDNLKIQFFATHTQELTVDVFNSVGQKVLSETLNADGPYYNDYNLYFGAGLSAGIYIVRVQSGEEDWVNRVMKGF
jgi:serine protease AprX